MIRGGHPPTPNTTYNQIIRCLTNTAFREKFLREDHNENGSFGPEQHPSA